MNRSVSRTLSCTQKATTDALTAIAASTVMTHAAIPRVRPPPDEAVAPPGGGADVSAGSGAGSVGPGSSEGANTGVGVSGVVSGVVGAGASD